LPLGLDQEFFHPSADTVLRQVDALLPEVALDLAKDIVVPRAFEIGRDDFLRIGFRSLALDAHQVGRP
jgi:hypothetical protein